jgi:hypothetical protein
MRFPPMLWYENKAGKRWIPRSLRKLPKPPRGFIYQRSRFPMMLHDSTCVANKGEILHGESTINEELVAAMVGLRPRPGRLKLSAAMLLVGIACERCLNAMAHRVGLKWGYPSGGKQWRSSKTRCELCKGRRRG